jgi:uncharacterized protein YdcH (DUF465 family)
MDSDLDGLRRRHQELEKRLAVIERHPSLTPAEQEERARLKKEKLWVKDRIQILVRSTPPSSRV